MHCCKNLLPATDKLSHHRNLSIIHLQSSSFSKIPESQRAGDILWASIARGGSQGITEHGRKGTKADLAGEDKCSSNRSPDCCWALLQGSLAEKLLDSSGQTAFPTSLSLDPILDSTALTTSEADVGGTFWPATYLEHRHKQWRPCRRLGRSTCRLQYHLQPLWELWVPCRRHCRRHSRSPAPFPLSHAEHWAKANPGPSAPWKSIPGRY